jgi:hypothetical protein
MPSPITLASWRRIVAHCNPPAVGVLWPGPTGLYASRYSGGLLGDLGVQTGAQLGLRAPDAPRLNSRCFDAGEPSAHESECQVWALGLRHVGTALHDHKT